MRSSAGPSRLAVVWLFAMQALAVAAQPAGRVTASPAAIAAENATLAARLADAEAAIERAAADFARLEKASEALDASMKRIEAYAKLPGRGGEFVRAVVDELHRLPRPEGLVAHLEHSRRVIEASDDDIRVERARAELADLDTAVARRAVTGGPEAADLRERLAAQRDLLTRLASREQDLLDLLQRIGATEQELGERSTQARADLIGHMFWIPVRPGARTLTELDDALAWTFSPANWSGSADALLRESVRRPLLPLGGLLVAVGLFAFRRRLRARLEALAPTRLRHILAALGLVVILALPGPLAMLTVGLTLETARTADPFALVLGEILRRAALLLLALLVTAAVLDPRGIGARHFGWDAKSLKFAAPRVRRFTALFVPLLILFAMNLADLAPFANRESLGRVGIVIAALLLAAFLAQVLGRRSVPMQQLAATSPTSWSLALHPLWFGGSLLLAAGIAGLAAGGYFVAAAALFGRLLFSLYLVLVAVLLYAVLSAWVKLGRGALAREESEATRSAAVHAAAFSGGALPAVPRPSADVSAIGAETHALVDLGVTLLLLGGMWLIWKDSVAALSDIANFRLWAYTDTVDGKEVTRPLTAGNLFFALVVAAVTAVVVRNVGALVDIVLLRRLAMQADATYAFKVTLRYLVAAAGIVLAAGVLGVAWSDVQWLVAALSVGLGFGLQEIFGNFVAGLIILAERAVRIGDVVTIGDVSGTVARIRARTITLVDFDNKEVLIPNKSLITDRVVNWTLSSQVTRLKIKVDVSRTTDLEHAQRVILAAVAANPDVLREPAPRVFFVSFGADALTLEISAFVGSFASRQRVHHEINVAVARVLREHAVKVEASGAGDAGGG